MTRGTFGKLFFRVPWNKIWKEPCHVVVENVHIFCTLYDKYNFDVNKEMIIEEKLKQLKEAEENEVNRGFLNYVNNFFRKNYSSHPRNLQLTLNSRNS